MARIIRYLLSEGLVDDAEDLADRLRKAHKVPYKTINDLWKQSGRNYNKFLVSLQSLEKEKTKELEKEPPIGGEEDISPLGHEELRDVESSEDGEETKDEAIIDVLQYLANLWRSKDRVRVVAARFGIDPDIYAAAGLGNIPEDYNDEDIWNTMDQSNQGQLPFYQSAWQPYYIDTLERLKELPLEVKEEIAEIIQQRQEEKRDVHYPVRSDKPYDDAGVAYESILVDDLIIEDNDGLKIISKGSKIFVFNP